MRVYIKSAGGLFVLLVQNEFSIKTSVSGSLPVRGNDSCERLPTAIIMLTTWLSGTIGSKQSKTLACLDREGDIVNGRKRFVLFGNIFQFNHILGSYQISGDTSNEYSM
jgi:hypothetical protein